jgi:hypothetical protein
MSAKTEERLIPAGAIRVGDTLVATEQRDQTWNLLVHHIKYEHEMVVHARSAVGRPSRHLTVWLEDGQAATFPLVEDGPKLWTVPWPEDKICASCLTEYEVVLEQQSDHEGPDEAPRAIRVLAVDRKEAEAYAWKKAFPGGNIDWRLGETCRVRKSEPIVVELYRPKPGKDGYIETVARRTCGAVYCDLYEALCAIREPDQDEDDTGGLIDEYFSGPESWRSGPTQESYTDRSPMPEYRSLEWSAAKGGSEGHYITGRAILKDSRGGGIVLFLGKTFKGLDHAYKIALACARLMDEG